MGCFSSKKKTDNQKEQQNQITNNTINLQTKMTQSINPNSPNKIFDNKNEPLMNDSDLNQGQQLFKTNIISQYEHNKQLIKQYKQQIQNIQNEYQQNLNSYPSLAKQEFQQFQTNEEQKSQLLKLLEIINKEYQQQNKCLESQEKLFNQMQNISVQPIQFKKEELSQLQQLPESSEKIEIIKKIGEQDKEIQRLFQEYNYLFININTKKQELLEKKNKCDQFLKEITLKLVSVDEAIRQHAQKKKEDQEQVQEEKNIQDEKEREQQEKNEITKHLQQIGNLYTKKFDDIELQMQKFEGQMALVNKKLESIQSTQA